MVEPFRQAFPLEAPCPPAEAGGWRPALAAVLTWETGAHCLREAQARPCGSAGASLSPSPHLHGGPPVSTAASCTGSLGPKWLLSFYFHLLSPFFFVFSAGPAGPQGYQSLSTPKGCVLQPLDLHVAWLKVGETLQPLEQNRPGGLPWGLRSESRYTAPDPF